MKKKDFERSCALCEHGCEVYGGDWCICKKKGVVSPTDYCGKFCFDPLKIKVSVRKIPKFNPLPEIK